MDRHEQEWNDMQLDAAARLADAMCIEVPEIEPQSIAIRIESSEPLSDFMHAVSRAANELHGQGEKSDRIAQQLFTALATFQKETELP